jgi:putative transposase
MSSVVTAALAYLASWFQSRHAMQLETLALRHQLAVYHHSIKQPQLSYILKLTWKVFLANHVKDIAACDFFTVPTVTFRILYVFIMLDHEHRRIVHVNVTEHPTAQWTAQQIVEAFPWETVPCYLLRDRDSIYGAAFQDRVGRMGIEEVKTAPRSPWQSPYVERVIGSIRRDALDHVIVLNERHLRRVLQSYIDYYHHWRTHRSLDMNAPETRPVQPPEVGSIRKLPEVGGLHHHYERQAA